MNESTPTRELLDHARRVGLDIAGGRIRRTASRFCLGVEHGDYNGTDLFGVGTDRFLWLGYRPNATATLRLFSASFPDDGVVAFRLGDTPEPRTPMTSWARFPFGVDWVLRREGVRLTRGADIVICSNIPGGGMSRSASLTLNLLLTLLEINAVGIDDGLRIVDLARAVENDYIGSPCGVLDPLMIYFARRGMGTLYRPGDRSIEHVPLGPGAIDFGFVTLDTGTERPGLERSTYPIRRGECEQLVELAKAEFGLECLADVRDETAYRRLVDRFGRDYPDLSDRLTYVFEAQRRFEQMLAAWRRGDVATIGTLFREDGYGLRDLYRISGPELESMCEIARTVSGVLGERMLGGGDKGAAGAIVAESAVEPLRRAIAESYPQRHPGLDFAVHACSVVDGISVYDGL